MLRLCGQVETTQQQLAEAQQQLEAAKTRKQELVAQAKVGVGLRSGFQMFNSMQ